MQWIVGHEPEHLVSSCNLHRYWSVIDSLQWNVESISKFDFEGANTLMGPSGPYFELIFLGDIVYEGWMGFQFPFVHKGYFGNYVRLHTDK